MKRVLLALLFVLSACTPKELTQAKDALDKLQEVCAVVKAAPAIPELEKARKACGVVDAVDLDVKDAGK